MVRRVGWKMIFPTFNEPKRWISLVNPKLVHFPAFFQGFQREKMVENSSPGLAKVWTLLASKACRYATMVGKVGQLGQVG